jgi:hypothetical protein
MKEMLLNMVLEVTSARYTYSHTLKTFSYQFLHTIIIRRFIVTNRKEADPVKCRMLEAILGHSQHRMNM